VVDLDTLTVGDLIVRHCGTYHLQFVKKNYGDSYQFVTVWEDCDGIDFLQKIDGESYSLVVAKEGPYDRVCTNGRRV
jgi:hypothetical protein